MDDATIIEFAGRDAVTDPLTDLLRKGARDLLQAAVEAERDAFLAKFAERRTADGRAAVVGSGYHPERAVQTGIGPVTVKVPKLRAGQRRQTGDVPLSACASVCPQSEIR